MQLFGYKRLRSPENADLELIRDWFQSELGSLLLDEEQGTLDQLLPGLFGYHLLEMSLADRPLAGSSYINHRLKLNLSSPESGNLHSSVVQLPFGKDSIDLVLLHHVLEFYESPKEILKEAARVVLPSGHIVIVGFNPFSQWGLWKCFARWSGNPPWSGRFVVPGTLMDWLNLLDFRIDRIQYSFYGPPLNIKKRSRISDFSGGLRSNWPLGAVYIIVARKEVAGVTPLRPGWTMKRSMPQLSVVRSSRVTRKNHTPNPSEG